MKRETYRNTFERAKKLGYARFPEHWHGDPRSKYVTHDRERGIFIFHDNRYVVPIPPLENRRQALADLLVEDIAGKR